MSAEYALWDTGRGRPGGWVPEYRTDKAGRKVAVPGSKARTTCYSRACLGAERLTVGLGRAVFVREVSRPDPTPAQNDRAAADLLFDRGEPEQ